MKNAGLKVTNPETGFTIQNNGCYAKAQSKSLRIHMHDFNNSELYLHHPCSDKDMIFTITLASMLSAIQI